MPGFLKYQELGNSEFLWIHTVIYFLQKQFPTVAEKFVDDILRDSFLAINHKLYRPFY